MSEERTFWIMGDCFRVIHSGADYGLVEAVTISRGQGPPLRYHEDADVEYQVLEGELEFWLDGEWRTVGKGESVQIEKGALHNTRNSSGREVKWRARWTPGGFERLIMEIGLPGSEAKACERSFSEEIVQRAVTNCVKYGMRLPDLDALR